MDGGDDSSDPRTIAWTTTEREVRRIFCPAPICSEGSQTAAIHRRALLERGHGEQTEGRESGQVRVVGVLSTEGGAQRHGDSGGMVATIGHKNAD